MVGGDIGIENQRWTTRIDTLGGIDARVHFLSYEPLLSPLSLGLAGIYWVIAGGESGPWDRTMHLKRV